MSNPKRYADKLRRKENKPGLKIPEGSFNLQDNFDLIQPLFEPHFTSLLKRGKEEIHAKLEISHPENESEKQADEFANNVVKGDTTKSQSTLEKNATDINKKSDGESLNTTSEFDSQLQNTKGQGNKLDTNTKSELENHTGTDLSGVNIHTNQNANELSENINAKAFTHGSDIYFKNGNYNPQSKEGKELLSHEVAHTVQQGGNLERKVQKKKEGIPKGKSLGDIGRITNKGGVTFDKANQKEQGYTFGCGTTSLSMVLDFYGIKLDEQEVDICIRDSNIDYFTPVSEIMTMTKHLDMIAQGYNGNHFKDIIANVDKNVPMIALIDASDLYPGTPKGTKGLGMNLHYIVIDGYEVGNPEKGIPHKIHITDPNGPGASNPWQDYEYFRNKMWEHVRVVWGLPLFNRFFYTVGKEGVGNSPVEKLFPIMGANEGLGNVLQGIGEIKGSKSKFNVPREDEELLMGLFRIPFGLAQFVANIGPAVLVSMGNLMQIPLEEGIDLMNKEGAGNKIGGILLCAVGFPLWLLGGAAKLAGNIFGSIINLPFSLINNLISDITLDMKVRRMIREVKGGAVKLGGAGGASTKKLEDYNEQTVTWMMSVLTAGFISNKDQRAILDLIGASSEISSGSKYSITNILTAKPEMRKKMFRKFDGMEAEELEKYLSSGLSSSGWINEYLTINKWWAKQNKKADKQIKKLEKKNKI